MTGPFPAPALSRTRGSLVTLQTWGRACAVIILCTSNTAARQNISSHDHGQKVNFALRLILAPYVRTTSGYNRDHLEIATWVSVLLFPFYRGGAKRLKKHEVEAPAMVGSDRGSDRPNHEGHEQALFLSNCQNERGRGVDRTCTGNL